MNQHDPEAEVTKMKDGTTHLAYKSEEAVDLETGAIVAITTHGGAMGDTTSVQETLPAVGVAVAEQIATPTVQGEYKVHEQGMREVVTDKSHGASGKANRSSKPRCTPTGGVWEGGRARLKQRRQAGVVAGNGFQSGVDSAIGDGCRNTKGLADRRRGCFALYCAFWTLSCNFGADCQPTGDSL